MGVGVDVVVVVLVGVGANSVGGAGLTETSGGAAAGGDAEEGAGTPPGGGMLPSHNWATPPNPSEPPCICLSSSSARGPLSTGALPAASGDLDLNAFSLSARTRREPAGSPGVAESTRGSGGRATVV